MDTARAQNSVTTFPAAPLLLEMHSHRMIDAILVLADAGFTVTHVAGTDNRFRIDDAQEHDRA